MKKTKTAKPEEKQLTPYEKAGMYTILEEYETETHNIAKLRTYGGATVTCRIPKHTPEEERELAANITRAMFRMIYPDRDFSGMTLRILTD